MTEYYISGKYNFSSKSIIKSLVTYVGDKNELKLEVPVSYRKYNWLIEPPESLDTLYTNFAKKIGNEAKGRIILGYTGGSDSYTMAYYFLKARVNVTYLHLHQPLKKKLFDSHHHVDKKIKELEELHEKFNMPKPEIILQPAAYYDSKFNESLLSDKYFYENEYIVNINRNYDFATSEIYGYLDDFVDDTLIIGLEKPRLFSDEKGIYWEHDAELYSFALGSKNYRRILFFADKSNPDIFAKQAHNILNWAIKGNPTKEQINQKLHTLRHSFEHYYLWCQLTGRLSDEKRSFLSVLTKPNVQIPYGFGIKERKEYNKFLFSRMESIEKKEHKQYDDIIEKLLQVGRYSPRTDKFYVFYFRN